MSETRRHPRDDYLTRSREPLQILVFLAPLIIAYELGAAFFLTNEDIRAHSLLSDFFQAFGVGGYYLPGVAMVVVLLVWQVIGKNRWRVSWPALGGMLLESAVWTIPLLVMAQMLAGMSGEVPAPAAAALAEAPAPPDLGSLPLGTRATIAIGAGLYEELLFRLVAIALVHLLVADLLGAPPRVADVIAVLAAAVAFALYHEDTTNFLFYTAAGVFFGGLFIARGLGIVVATHAIYDLVVLLL